MSDNNSPTRHACPKPLASAPVVRRGSQWWLITSDGSIQATDVGFRESGARQFDPAGVRPCRRRHQAWPSCTATLLSRGLVNRRIECDDDVL
ncbi:hypothetical protein ACFV1W_13275 [Kitasatospora sp. NPDC059648]|uniref:hypothetical protein n=1 Tax=Kitasatospora sp. NPDC059648 TaxID=3346894 RepID=UPI00367A395A